MIISEPAVGVTSGALHGTAMDEWTNFAVSLGVTPGPRPFPLVAIIKDILENIRTSEEKQVGFHQEKPPKKIGLKLEAFFKCCQDSWAKDT